MSYGESQEDQLKMIFRTQELQRRQARQRIMLNHIELAKEPLSPEELQQDVEIKEQLHRVTLTQEKAMLPGYWRRLWAAIRGL